MKIKVILMSLFMVAVTSSGLVKSQEMSKADAKKQAKQEKQLKAAMATDELLNNKTFCFVPTRVPGSNINITSYYEFRVTPEKITSDLPFYGQALGAFKDRRKSPHEFEADNFQYSKQGIAKGDDTSMITINIPKPSNDVPFKVQIEVYSDQTAQMSISGGGMSSMFQGNIVPVPKK